MSNCYLDTQIVVWLCEAKTNKLSKTAASAIDQSQLIVSPMVLMELAYLYEIKRILKPPLALLNQLKAQIGLEVRDHSFAAIVHTALFEDWTHDPFDRVIVAQARTDGYARLITSDEKIRENYAQSIW